MEIAGQKNTGLPIPRELLIEILSKFAYFHLIELRLVGREFNNVIQNTTGGVLAKARFREQQDSIRSAPVDDSKVQKETPAASNIEEFSPLQNGKDRLILHPCIAMLKIKYFAIQANKISIDDIGFVNNTTKAFTPLRDTFTTGENAIQSVESFADREDLYPGPYIYSNNAKYLLNKLTVEQFVNAYLATNMFAFSYPLDTQQGLLNMFKAMNISDPNLPFVSPTDFSSDSENPSYRTLLRHPRETRVKNNGSRVTYRRHAVQLRLGSDSGVELVPIVIDRRVNKKNPAKSVL